MSVSPISLRKRSVPLLSALCLLVALVLSGCTSPRAVLSGVVVDEYTGEPVANAAIKIGSQTLNTDANGSFATREWSANDTLEVSAPSYEGFSLSLEGRPEVQQTDSTTITLQTTLRPNTFGGTLTDAFTGKPLSGAVITATDGLSITLSATSDANGQYSLSGVPEKFSVTISAPDYAPIAQDFERSISFDSALRPNTLSGVITDRYTSQPIAGVTVSAGSATATSDAEGRYRLTDIPEDADAVKFVAEGYTELSQQLDQTTAIDAVLRPDTPA